MKRLDLLNGKMLFLLRKTHQNPYPKWVQQSMIIFINERR